MTVQAEEEPRGRTFEGLKFQDPLLNAPDLSSPGEVEMMRYVIEEFLVGGLLPSVSVVEVEGYMTSEYRLVVRFDVEREMMTLEQVEQLGKIAEDAYTPRKVETDLGQKKHNYPLFEKTRTGKDRTDNRYVGLCFTTQKGWKIDSSTQGLMVMRFVKKASVGSELKKRSADWLVEPIYDPRGGKQIKNKYIVEFRESELSEARLIEVAVRMGMILSGQEVPDDLLYQIYQRINELRFDALEHESVGLESRKRYIQTVLINPLAARETSRLLGVVPRSVLLVGQPGTGKTLTVRELMKANSGVFIVPLEAYELACELSKSPEDREIFKHLETLKMQTGRQVILHVDDIEQLVEDGATTKTTLMNLFAGVYEYGITMIASTNKPELLSEQILEFDRLGHMVYYPLPSNKARVEIIDRLVMNYSLGEDMIALFRPGDRDVVRRMIWEATAGYRTREIREVCILARAIYINRIIELFEIRPDELTLEHLRQFPMEISDWRVALNEIEARVDPRHNVQMDEQMRNKVYAGLGSNNRMHLYPPEEELEPVPMIIKIG